MSDLPRLSSLRQTRSVRALAILLASLWATSGQAGNTMAWTAGSGAWGTGANWIGSAAPGAGDTASFTNNATYTVSLGAPVMGLNQCVFGAPGGTVTLDVGAANMLAATNGTATPGGAVLIGSASGNNASVALVSGMLLASNDAGTARLVVGAKGLGTLDITNATAYGNQVALGDNSAAGHGTLRVWTGGTLNAGSNTLSIGFGGSTGGNNTLIVDGGMVTNVGSLYVKGSITTGNTVIVRNGGQLIRTVNGLIDYIGNGSQCFNSLTVLGGTGVTSSVALGTTSTGNEFIGGASSTSYSTGNWARVDGAGVFGSAVLTFGGSGALLVGFGASMVGNQLIVTNGGVLNAQAITVGSKSGAIGIGPYSNQCLFGGGSTICSGNVGAVTIGSLTATLTTNIAGNQMVTTNAILFSKAVTVGSASPSNTLNVLANTTWDLQTNTLIVGSSAGATGNLMVINGGVVTNAGGTSIGSQNGYCGSSLVLTNGGQLVLTGASDFKCGDRANGNTTWIGAGGMLSAPGRSLYVGGGSSTLGATGNVLTVDVGGSALSFKDLFVGRAGFGVSNLCTIANGGQVIMQAGGTARVGYDNTNGFVNVLAVLNGGLLETPTLMVDQATAGGSISPAPAGDCITNSGGIYQFSTAASGITITTSANGRVYLNSGTIAFRAITNADVKANGSGALANITYSGHNAFRLNNATNLASSSQTYLFDDMGNSTNWVRLEMVSGATRYRGQAGNTLTIGAGGAMLCSNTAAAVDLVFTNNGTLTLVNSTLALNANAVLAGTVVIDLDHLTNGIPVAAQNLTLVPGSTLRFTGTPTNTTLFTYTSRSGAFAVQGLPATYTVRYSNASGTIMLQQAPPGMVLIVR